MPLWVERISVQHYHVGSLSSFPVCRFVHLVLVVQRLDNFIRWIRHYSGSNIYFTLNVVQGCGTLPNLAVVRVCIFACTQGNTEIFAQIETVR